jgi:hypothetical protein
MFDVGSIASMLGLDARPFAQGMLPETSVGVSPARKDSSDGV